MVKKPTLVTGFVVLTAAELWGISRLPGAAWAGVAAVIATAVSIRLWRGVTSSEYYKR